MCLEQKKLEADCAQMKCFGIVLNKENFDNQT